MRTTLLFILGMLFEADARLLGWPWTKPGRTPKNIGRTPNNQSRTPLKPSRPAPPPPSVAPYSPSREFTFDARKAPDNLGRQSYRTSGEEMTGVQSESNNRPKGRHNKGRAPPPPTLQSNNRLKRRHNKGRAPPPPISPSDALNVPVDGLERGLGSDSSSEDTLQSETLSESEPVGESGQFLDAIREARSRLKKPSSELTPPRRANDFTHLKNHPLLNDVDKHTEDISSQDEWL